MDLLYTDRDRVVANSNATREAVTAFFGELRQALEQREKAVLNTVRKYTDIKLSTLDLNHQKLQEDHMAITKGVENLERLLHANDSHLDASLLTNGGALEEELGLHQNSVLSVCDGIEEAKFAARFLSFSGDEVHLGETLREAGVLNECQRIPDTNILSMQRVLVSEQEDPYLLVPSRFEDLQTSGPREEVRIDGTKKSQRVMKMSDMVEDGDIQYQLPRDFLGSPTGGGAAVRSLAEGLFQSPTPTPSFKTVRQMPARNGNTSPTTIYCQQQDQKKKSPEPTPRQPPVPLRRARGSRKPAPPPPQSENHTGHRKPPPPLPPKDDKEEIEITAADLYDVPRSLMQVGGGPEDMYDVPRSLLQSHTVMSEDTYDVPRKLLSSSPLESSAFYSDPDYQQLSELSAGEPSDIYDVPKPLCPAPPPRPPKPVGNSISSSSSTSSLLSPPPTHSEDLPAGVIPPRGYSPKPKPRIVSMSGFDYINTHILLPEQRRDTSPTHQPAGRIRESASSSNVRTKPIPAPRPAKRSHTMREVPQSAPPMERVREKFRWNGEACSAEADKRMSTLPPDIKLHRNGFSGHREPFSVISAEQLARPMNDERVHPCGVCCSPITGLLVMTDVYNHCVRLIDPKTGCSIEKIGREGRSGGNFKEPSAVVMDSDEHIFVTELDNPRVQKFTSRGKYLQKFGQKAFWGSQLHDPYGLAISPDGHLYITDWEKGRIVVYQKDGRHISTIGKDHAFLKFPAGLVFDRFGNLLVTDRGKHCVWVMSPDGKPTGRIGKFGTGDGELILPHGIAVLNNNSIAVSESGNHRVSIFAPSGKFICSFGGKGTKPGMFHYPRHVCVDSKGHLVVADEHNQRIQIFDV